MNITLKKLSDFKGAQAAEVVGELLIQSGEIIANIDVVALSNAKNNIDALGIMLKSAPNAFFEIFKILSENNEEVDQIGAGETASAMFQLASDSDFMKLFGLQSKTSPSSGSVSASTEGPET